MSLDVSQPPAAAADNGIPALKPVPAVGLVVASITSVQFGSAVAATMFDRAGAAGIASLRLILAAALLLAVFRPWRRRYDRAAMRVAAGLGVVLGAMNVSFYASIDRIPLGVAVTIEFLGPIAVATIYSRRRQDLIWIGLALCGVVLLAEPWRAGGSLDGLGMALAAVAALFWGLYIVLQERTGDLFSGGDGLAIALVWGAAVAVIPGAIDGGTHLLEPGVLAAGLAVSILSSVIPYTFELEALRRLTKTVFGTLMSLEPAIAALAGLIVLGQALHAREIVAIALVIAASVGVTRGARAGAPEPRDG